MPKNWNERVRSELNDSLAPGLREPPTLQRDADLVALAETLRANAPFGQPDPAFRATLRAELIGPTTSDRYVSLVTPVGRLWLAYHGEIPRLIWAGDEGEFLASARRLLGGLPVRDDVPPSRLVQRVLAAIEGARPYAGQVDLSPLTPFQRAVLEQTRRIPRGEVRPYSWIAREIGHPRAVRAVGTALAHNPLPFIIPCHRVVRQDGDIGAYSGGGPGTKERVLAFEGVDLAYLRELAERKIRFRGSRNTRIFCLPTCSSHKRALPQHTVYFHSTDEAFAAGFRPCKLCRPSSASA